MPVVGCGALRSLEAVALVGLAKEGGEGFVWGFRATITAPKPSVPVATFFRVGLLPYTSRPAAKPVWVASSSLPTALASPITTTFVLLSLRASARAWFLA